MLKIGITGGIGSGKSTACKIFEELGIPVYYSDQRGKWLMQYDAELKSQIKELFGAAAYLETGELNRAFIAQLVFNDESLLKQLNQLVHPAVGKDGEAWHNQQKDVPYTLKEAAILFESGGHKLMDYVIVVSAPEEIRIQRVVKRDHTTPEAVKARIDKQWPEAELIKRSDFVLKNDGVQALIPQILAIHKKLLTFASK